MSGDLLPPEFVEQMIEDLPPGTQGRTDAAEDAARRVKAVTMRLAGMTYEQVAEQAGYSDKSAARQTVMRALERVEQQRVDDLRALENARLDRAQAAIWPKVIGGDIKAVDSFLRLSARRARMNGLDAPVSVTINPGTQAALTDALADLREIVLGEVTHVDDDTG